MAKETTRLIKIAAKLEHELLAAAIRGACSPSIVDPKELSKIGRIVHASLIQLSKNGLTAPFKLATIFTDCISNRGAPEEDTRQFLRTVQECYSTKDHKVLLKVAKEKETLVKILNEASKQLSSGDVGLRKFQEITEKQQAASDPPKSMSERYKDYDGTPHEGLSIPSFPTITKAARGVQGVWVVGGYEGVGKSTFALQLALELQVYHKVLYYDIDGTGETWMVYRVSQAVGKESFQERTKSIFYRESIESLDSDLITFPPPTVLVIDSIQTLPYQVQQRRSSVDGWLNTFKALTNKGYVIILISELSREGEYKESSGINYAGTVNIELQEDQDMLAVNFKKNRHGPQKGHITSLVRNAQYPYWLEEV